MPPELGQELLGYMESSLAPGTRSSLRTALCHFRRFIDTMPARTALQVPRWEGDLHAILHNEMTFMLFLVYLVEKGKRQASTALNYCSLARSHLASAAGFSMTSQTPRWKKLVRAIKKAHRRERKERRALRITHLRRAFGGELAAQDVQSVNRWAAVVCGVHLLARPQELANLRRSHLTFAQHPIRHAVVSLMPLKKGPEQQPVPMLIAAGDGGGGDAFAALARLVEIDPVPVSQRAVTPLFRDRYRRAPSVPTLSLWVQQVVRGAGEGAESRLYSAHSMRIGGATELHAVGANELTISLLGRWSSDCARLYTRASQGQVLALSRQLAGAPDDPTLEQVFEGYVQTARR